MTVVRLYASFRRLAGEGAVDLVVPAEGTIRDILRGLVELRPRLAEHMLDEEGNVPRFVNVFVNGRDIRYLNGLDTLVRPEDEVAIFPPLAGG